MLAVYSVAAAFMHAYDSPQCGCKQHAQPLDSILFTPGTGMLYHQQCRVLHLCKQICLHSPVVLVQLCVGWQGLCIDGRDATCTADGGVQSKGTAWQQQSAWVAQHQGAVTVLVDRQHMCYIVRALVCC
jgi:hypothetical protein